MTSQKVYAHNILTDVVRPVPAHYLTHPILGANLRPVRNGKTRGRLSEIVGTDEKPEETEEAPTGPPTEPTPLTVARLEEKKDD